MENLESISGELLADIVSRLDGLALSSLGCTSSYLRGIARDHTLWEKLCHSTWPSTAIHHHLIPRFDRFFADSFPFIFYDEATHGRRNFPIQDTSTSPLDFVSFVDVYYKNRCVFSTVVHGIPEAADAFQRNLIDTNSNIIADERWKWFLHCPFKLQLIQLTYEDVEDEDFGRIDDLRTSIDSNERSASMTLKLMEDLRLSWILLDKTAGKAVNLSTWKPFSIHSVWPHRGEYVMHFGSVIPVEESLLPQKLAMCKITTKFRVMEKHDRLLWREIGMSIVDISGTPADGGKSLMILCKALYSLRTTKRLKVKNGFREYEKRKKDMKRKQELGETVANGVYIFTEMVVLAIICNALIHLY